MYLITEARMGLPKNKQNGWQLAQILYIEETKLYFRVDRPLAKREPECQYYIHFEQNRMPHQMNRFALDLLAQRRLEPFIFPKIDRLMSCKTCPTNIKFQNM